MIFHSFCLLYVCKLILAHIWDALGFSSENKCDNHGHLYCRHNLLVVPQYRLCTTPVTSSLSWCSHAPISLIVTCVWSAVWSREEAAALIASFSRATELVRSPRLVDPHQSQPVERSKPPAQSVQLHRSNRRSPACSTLRRIEQFRSTRRAWSSCLHGDLHTVSRSNLTKTLDTTC
jgi:hypothetical protein